MVGCTEGKVVGAKFGLEVPGLNDGTTVGWSVGDPVDGEGCLVGPNKGELVGLSVVVGTGDGCVDGSVVGGSSSGSIKGVGRCVCVDGMSL